MTSARTSIAVENSLAAEEVRDILGALPDWFGLPDAIEAYAREAERLTAITARTDGRLVGFTSLNPIAPAACEFAVMAVRPEHHRRGHGRALIVAGTDWMRSKGYSLALVRTLAASQPDPFYACTRRFYAACGFSGDFVDHDLWGPENPSLLMSKVLAIQH